MPFQEAFDDFAVEKFSISREALFQRIDEHASQRAAKPLMSGNVKARLFALQDRSGKFVFPQFTQNKFLLCAADFQFGRELRRKFHDSVIEKRGTNLDGMRHAHAIALHQDIVSQIVILVEPEQRSKMVSRSRQSIHLLQNPME